MDSELRDRIRTATLALLFGGLAAIAVAATVPDPVRAFVPLIGAGIVLYGLRLYVDSWTVPQWVWQVPLAGAAIVRLNPDQTTIYWTGGTLAALSALVFLLLPVVDRTLEDRESEGE